MLKCRFSPSHSPRRNSGRPVSLAFSSASPRSSPLPTGFATISVATGAAAGADPVAACASGAATAFASGEGFVAGGLAGLSCGYRRDVQRRGSAKAVNHAGFMRRSRTSPRCITTTECRARSRRNSVPRALHPGIFRHNSTLGGHPDVNIPHSEKPSDRKSRKGVESRASKPEPARESPQNPRAARFTPQQAEDSSRPENSTAFNGSGTQSTVIPIAPEPTSGNGPGPAASNPEAVTAPGQAPEDPLHVFHNGINCTESFISYLKNVQEVPRLESRLREHDLQISRPQRLVGRLAQHLPEVCRNRQIAAFVQLLLRQPRPLPVDLPALHRSAQHEHHVRVPVVRPASPVLPARPPKLRHRHQHDVLRLVPHIRPERRQVPR